MNKKLFILEAAEMVALVGFVLAMVAQNQRWLLITGVWVLYFTIKVNTHPKRKI